SGTDVMSVAALERIAGYYERLLAAMTEDRIGDLRSEQEQAQIKEWNKTPIAYSREKCINELFEEQVEKTPEAVAVVCEDQQLTYRELNRRTNQLGHYLRSLGVGPDTRVAICLERGLDMMTAVLGVLKAGGAYVPLDAGYPKDRLRYMAEDTKPSLIISSR